jgi:hypothetical protein
MILSTTTNLNKRKMIFQLSGFTPTLSTISPEAKMETEAEEITRLKADLAKAERVNLLLAAKLADAGCCADYKPAVCGRCSGLCHLAEAEKKAGASDSGILLYGHWRKEVLQKLAAVGRVFAETPTDDYEIAAEFDMPVYKQRRTDGRDIWLGFTTSQDGNNVKVTVWEQQKECKNKMSLSFSRSDKFFAAHDCRSTLYVAKSISNIIGLFEMQYNPWRKEFSSTGSLPFSLITRRTEDEKNINPQQGAIPVAGIAPSRKAKEVWDED